MLVAFLAARSRDVASAEDALSEAFPSALADWPKNGCPDNPEAWLLRAARRKLIDFARRRHSGENAATQLQFFSSDTAELTTDTGIPDNRLALMFACAHPAIDAGIRAPLILQVILGLEASTIASAFLMSPAAMGQRLVRAKNKIRQAGIPFSIPGRELLSERSVRCWVWSAILPCAGFCFSGRPLSGLSALSASRWHYVKYKPPTGAVLF